MKKAGFTLFGIFIFLFCVSFVSAGIINVPGDYANIQDAIDTATSGDMINVSAGTYDGQLTINKNDLIIQGNGAEDTIINLKQPTETTGIWITANNVLFDGFTIINISTTSGHAQYAIRVRGSNNTISNNKIIGQSIRDWWTDEEDSAINLDGTTSTITSNNLVEDNEVYNFSAMGIQIVGSGGFYNAYDNIIRNNKISNIDYYAIANDRSANQEIRGNILTNIGPSGHINDGVPAVGIIVWGSNSVNTEIVSMNLVGIETGIVLSAAKNIKIKNSEIRDNGIGIRLAKSSWLEGKVENNEIINNTIKNNIYGIFIGSGNSSQIGNNNINYNEIYENNFGLNSSADEENNAEYNWWESCDGPSGIGSGSGDSVYGNVDYVPWIGACAKNKTFLPKCVVSSDNVTLYVNVSSLICIGNVKFGININGIWQNYTGIKTIVPSPGNYSYAINSNLLIAGQNVSWTVYADDCYNHTYQNGIKSFYVNRRTNLSVAPSNPDGWNSWYITEPLFSLINPDASKIWYRWDSTGALLYSVAFGLDNIPNLPKETAGILELNWFSNICSAELGKNESEQNRTFKIDLTNPEIKDLVPENGSTVVNNLKPTIQADLDEVYGGNSGIDKTSVIMKVDGIVVDKNVFDDDSLNAIVRHNPPNNLALGRHNVSVYVKDKAGRESELNWSFNISVKGIFNFSVYAPINKLYGEKKIPFNISATEELEKIEYMNWNELRLRWKKLCSKCDEYGNKDIKTKSFNDGFQNITIRATDYFDQTKEVNVLFSIDSKAPVISKTEPRRNSVINGSEFYIKYTEDNLQNITLFWNPNKTLENCSAGKNQECTTFVNLSAFDGDWIEYWFEVSDSINTVQSKKTRVLVDTTSPILEVYSPKNKIYNSKIIPFNITISEDVLLEYIDNSVASPRWRRLTSNSDEYGNTRMKTLTFKRGNHNIQIRATDRAGNAIGEHIIFSVDY